MRQRGLACGGCCAFLGHGGLLRGGTAAGGRLCRGGRVWRAGRTRSGVIMEMGRGEEVDMEALRRRIRDIGSRSEDVVDIGMAMQDARGELGKRKGRLGEEFEQVFEGVSELWVIVFKSRTDDDEGVYSLSIEGESIVLAFQEKEEAQRYATGLEAQSFPSPHVCSLQSDELQEFCSTSGFRLGFVPTNSHIVPPEESSVEDMDKWKGADASDTLASLSPEDVAAMKRRLDSLFGQS